MYMYTCVCAFVYYMYMYIYTKKFLEIISMLAFSEITRNNFTISVYKLFKISIISYSLMTSLLAILLIA